MFNHCVHCLYLDFLTHNSLLRSSLHILIRFLMFFLSRGKVSASLIYDVDADPTFAFEVICFFPPVFS